MVDEMQATPSTASNRDSDIAFDATFALVQGDAKACTVKPYILNFLIRFEGV